MNASDCDDCLLVSLSLSLTFCLTLSLGSGILSVFCRGLCHRRCDAKLAGQLNTYFFMVQHKSSMKNGILTEKRGRGMYCVCFSVMGPY